MDPLNNINADVGRIARQGYEVAQTLYEIGRDDPQDQRTAFDVAAEMVALAKTCASVETRLQGLMQQTTFMGPDKSMTRSWMCTSKQLAQCETTIQRLDRIVSDARDDMSRREPYMTGRRRTKLNMTDSDMNAMGRRIRRNAMALLVSLHIIDVVALHPSRRQASLQYDALQAKLALLVTQTRDSDLEVEDRKDHDDLLQYASDVLSLHDSTVPEVDANAFVEPPQYEAPPTLPSASDFLPPYYAKMPPSRAEMLKILQLSVKDEVNLALLHGNPELALQLLRRRVPRHVRNGGSSISRKSTDPPTLHLAALFGEVEVARVVVSSSKINATCTVPYSYGQKATALHFAVAARQNDIISLLVSHGARLDGQADTIPRIGSKFSYHPPAFLALRVWLDLTAGDSASEVTSTLTTLLSLRWKVDSPVDSVFRTLLHLGVRLPQEMHGLRAPLVRFLLDNGANHEARSLVGCIPLHFAARWNASEEIVTILLEAGRAEEQVSCRDKFGNTPLHDAMWNRRDHGPNVAMGILRRLVEAGARADCKNDRGQTPLDIATLTVGRQEHEDVEAIAFLNSTLS